MQAHILWHVVSTARVGEWRTCVPASPLLAAACAAKAHLSSGRCMLQQPSRLWRPCLTDTTAPSLRAPPPAAVLLIKNRLLRFTRVSTDGKAPPLCRRYGQTGTGKTYTMDGGAAPHLRGVIPRTFDHVFAFIKGGESGASQFLVRCAFVLLPQKLLK